MLTLCYHHVSPERTANATSPDRFGKQLDRMLEAGFRFVDHDHFVGIAQGRFRDSRRLVLLTLDDGHADNWFHARPELVGRGIPAVLFAVTDRLEPGEPRADEDEPRLEPGEDEDRAFFMRWSEVAAWRDTGLLSVQSHTHSHTDIRQLSRSYRKRPVLAAADVARSLDEIEANLGERPVSLAWPWGMSTGRGRRRVRRLGVRYQFTVVPGLNTRFTPRAYLHRLASDGADPDVLTRWMNALAGPGLATVSRSVSRALVSRVTSQRFERHPATYPVAAGSAALVSTPLADELAHLLG